MSEIRTFFRFCPACGRRFHLKLMSKKLIDDEKERVETEMPHQQLHGGGNFGIIAAITEVDENLTTVIDTQKFQYAYKCKHCGHVWYETRTKQTEV
jgi:hypothetical protein